MERERQREMRGGERRTEEKRMERRTEEERERRTEERERRTEEEKERGREDTWIDGLDICLDKQIDGYMKIWIGLKYHEYQSDLSCPLSFSNLCVSNNPDKSNYPNISDELIIQSASICFSDPNKHPVISDNSKNLITRISCCLVVRLTLRQQLRLTNTQTS
jgi:hypothetical protein